MTIPNELSGTIIGRGGERINRIRDETGATISKLEIIVELKLALVVDRRLNWNTFEEYLKK